MNCTTPEFHTALITVDYLSVCQRLATANYLLMVRLRSWTWPLLQGTVGLGIRGRKKKLIMVEFRVKHTFHRQSKQQRKPNLTKIPRYCVRLSLSDVLPFFRAVPLLFFFFIPFLRNAPLLYPSIHSPASPDVVHLSQVIWNIDRQHVGSRTESTAAD